MQNSSAASQRNKKYYDKKTQDRKFSVGEEVSVLLPSASNKLLTSWLGPFPITKVFHPDYRVLVKGKEKVFHANMLKRYVRREEAADVAVGGSRCVQSVGDFVPWREISPLLDEVDMSVPKVPSTSSGDFHAVESVCSAGVIQDHGEDVSIPTLSVPMSTSIPDEDVSCVQFDAALSEVQLDELKAVFQAHADILTTRPGVFSGNLMLEIPLTSDVPIRRKMYNLPFSSEEVVEKEIQVMLDLEIIEPSKSPYSSPVVLVRKKDGSCRFCIDFRGLNKITVFDAEPIPNVTISADTIHKLETRRERKTVLNNSRTRAAKARAQEEYMAVDREIKRSIKKDKTSEGYIDDLARQAETAAGQGNMRDLYLVTKKPAGKFQQTDKPVMDKNGNPLTTTNEQLKQ